MSIENMRFATRISKAILAGDKKMLLEDGSILEIPGGQKCGTEYQKQTYDNQKALKIIDELEKKKNE